LFDRILTPLDGTSEAEAGLAWAQRTAANCGAALELLSIVDTNKGPLNERPTAAKNYLDSKRQHLSAVAPDVEVRTEVAVGPLREELLSRAQDAPLTVMTYTTSRWLQGGALDLMLRGMVNPIVVHPSPRTDQSADAGSRILAPVSTAAGSLGALHVAGGLADALTADVMLCEVVTPPLGAFSKRFPKKQLTEIMDEETEMAQQALAAAAKEVAAKGVPVDSVVRVGEPAREILRAAKETDAGLIAMATRGTESMSRMMGSVAIGVMQASPVPCLLVHPPAAG
jgi:nucleotide-binding universal stress UspA family protein